MNLTLVFSGDYTHTALFIGERKQGNYLYIQNVSIHVDFMLLLHVSPLIM